jgi:hypothetical protein
MGMGMGMGLGSRMDCSPPRRRRRRPGGVAFGGLVGILVGGAFFEFSPKGFPRRYLRAMYI